MPENDIEPRTSNNPQLDPSSETSLRRQIEDYYLPTQLVDAILSVGQFPSAIEVTEVGIGFLDIADYSLLSRFLTPRENQDILNGLYTAFNQVLKEHGGYLNKIEGDSIMFHFGGNIDPNVRDMSEAAARNYVARELFNTCVELQRKCALFNAANSQFISASASDEVRQVMRKAFDIIEALRANPIFGALYQVRVRIGASIGEVTIGNFGPAGAKQWDVIGQPVIEAKRMESTAPIGGLRISERLYTILEKSGKVDEYYERFRREALVLSTRYTDIAKEDLFRPSAVLLKDKGDVTFNTYKVQVYAQLPTAIADQVRFLAGKRDQTRRIMGLLQYYRGNKYVIWAIEDALKDLGVVLRKGFIFKTMYPSRYQKIAADLGNDREKIEASLDAEYTLFDLLDRLGRFQDIVKQRDPPAGNPDFVSYDSYMDERVSQITQNFTATKERMVQRAYFFNVVFPLVFDSIESSIRECQERTGVLEPSENGLEALDGPGDGGG